MSKEVRQTAAANAYQAHANDIAKLIDIIEVEVASRAKRVQTDRGAWELVGTAAGLRVRLVEIVASLTGRDEPAVLECLADSQ